jgi:hypothetical protein
VNKIFFIVNKTDLVTKQECSEILQFVTQTIQAHTGSEQVKVFPVAAKLSCSPVLYKESGLKALEETLANFLSGEKSSAFLAAIAYKALQIFALEASQSAFEEISLQARSKAVQSEKPLTYQREPHSAAKAALAAQQKIETLYKNLLHNPIALGTSNEDVFSATSQTPAVPIIPDCKSPLSPADIVTDLKTRGCPVCHHLTKQAADFFAQWQYRLGTEEQVQKELPPQPKRRTLCGNWFTLRKAAGSAICFVSPRRNTYPTPPNILKRTPKICAVLP